MGLVPELPDSCSEPPTDTASNYKNVDDYCFMILSLLHMDYEF